LAPRAGFEPATNRLTAGCSTAELPGTNGSGLRKRSAYNKAWRDLKAKDAAELAFPNGIAGRSRASPPAKPAATWAAVWQAGNPVAYSLNLALDLLPEASFSSRSKRSAGNGSKALRPLGPYEMPGGLGPWRAATRPASAGHPRLGRGRCLPAPCRCHRAERSAAAVRRLREWIGRKEAFARAQRNAVALYAPRFHVAANGSECGSVKRVDNARPLAR
jgi:hypothetical protein